MTYGEFRIRAGLQVPIFPITLSWLGLLPSNELGEEKGLHRLPKSDEMPVILKNVFGGSPGRFTTGLGA